jgi:hypothetical protein
MGRARTPLSTTHPQSAHAISMHAKGTQAIWNADQNDEGPVPSTCGPGGWRMTTVLREFRFCTLWGALRMTRPVVSLSLPPRQGEADNPGSRTEEAPLLSSAGLHS